MRRTTLAAATVLLASCHAMLILFLLD